MLKNYLQRFFKNKFYPTKHGNWYKEKNYHGDNLLTEFANFIQQQRQKGAIYYHSFQNITLTRQLIPSGQAQLDSIIMKPQPIIASTKAGYGKYIILFQGRGEYYEARFRDAAIAAQITGANILAFNPKGLNYSSGEINTLNDLVDDGIVVTKYLLKKNIAPQNIIFQGNSLGAAIQEMVSEYFIKNHQLRFRQINSNSFKNLSSVIANYYQLPFTAYFWRKLLIYSGWEITPGKQFYQTGPFKIYFRRRADQTLKGKCQFHFMVNPVQDYLDSPAGYREINKWLNSKSQLLYTGGETQDPHEIPLSKFVIDEPEKRNIFELINIFLKESEPYIN